jgi:hypothetical protein
MNEHTARTRLTEEPLTLEEEYEMARFASLGELEQRIYLTHLQDQFEAIPSYVERWRYTSSSSSTNDQS